MELALVVLVIVVALVFDFINGFHDAANSIATVVSTRVLSPGQAVIWAAFFNFVAAFVFGTAVAKTVGSGHGRHPDRHLVVILAGLLGAIVWDLITWYYGLPTSSSHALIGGFAGAAMAKVGMVALIPSGWTKTLIFIVLAPLFGFVLGFVFMVAVYWICRNARAVACRSIFRKLQLVSAALYSLGHGERRAKDDGNHRRRALSPSAIPGVHDSVLGRDRRVYAISLGTMAGGWRIINTMGSKITRLQPVGGFAAEPPAPFRCSRDRDRRPGQHDAHDHRRDHRRRSDAAVVGGAMGHCRSDRLGMGSDHPAVCRVRRRLSSTSFTRRLAVSYSTSGQLCPRPRAICGRRFA